MQLQLPKKVKLVEVGPRDGLQNEKQIIPTAAKIEFINRLSATGLKVIEATSFVSPKWVPQLADASSVFSGIEKHPQIRYPVLIPNMQGLEAALAVGVKEIAVFTTPSEQFSQHNTHCSVADSMKRITEIMKFANAHDLPVRAYLSCVLGCPYEGKIAVKKVSELAKQLFELGCYEISLGDTIGVGTPIKTQQLLTEVSQVIPVSQIAVHFHDTYGQALANIFVALISGVTTIDASIAGLGGCPYAKGASGNVATEDVLYMLNEMNIETGVDLKKVLEVSQFITQTLGSSSHSKVAKALSS